MKRLPLLVTTLGLSAALLAGCGGGNDEFCKDLRSAKSDLSGNAVASTNYEKTVDRIHTLAEEAPDDAKADWETLDKTYSRISKTFDEAGVTPEVLTQLQKGEKPKGVSTEDLQKVATEIQSVFGDSKFTKAQEDVTKHAKDTCDVNLDS